VSTRAFPRRSGRPQPAPSTRTGPEASR
jgi:hypothetical protein